MITTQSAACRYLGIVGTLISECAEHVSEIERAAEVIAASIAHGHSVYAFGTGHSHMLVEELFYRAGGLTVIRPIFFEGLMLHGSTALSTALERLPGLGTSVVAEYDLQPGDVLLVISNSGANAAVVEAALHARSAGASVIALTSLQHATSTQARVDGGTRIHALADVVLDNRGKVGDAALAIEGVTERVSATSTVIGAALLQAVVAATVERLVLMGNIPPIYRSANLEATPDAGLGADDATR